MDKRTTKTFKKQFGSFCGWINLRKTFLSIDDIFTKEIFLTAFKTGGRAMECASLKRGNIDIDSDPNQIYVHGMLVEKQKEIIYLEDEKGNPLLINGKRKYKFNSIDGFRNFYIPKFEPLNNFFIEGIRNLNDNEYVLQNQYGEPYKYHQMYYKICKIGVPQVGFGGNGWCHRKGYWWLHRIRSERMCQLIVDYKYDVYRLQHWAGWTDPEMSFEYVNMNPRDLIVNTPPAKWS